MKKGFYLILFVCFQHVLLGQYPPYFQSNVESGAPSNEIYWVSQDNKGFIWIGCDAGLYRFNGIRYEHFSSDELSARSATGVIQSKTTGRIYAYNFNRQLFYVEKNKLKVISNWKGLVNGLADDGKGSIWISSNEGTFKLNERNNELSFVPSSKYLKGPTQLNYSTHCISDSAGRIYYQNGSNIFIWQNGKSKKVHFASKNKTISLVLSRHSQHPWIISFNGEKIYRFIHGKYQDYKNPKLLNVLSGKKINFIYESKDRKLWIGTYTGLVCHNPKNNTTELLYDHFSFSFGIEDNEGNYWFSTLHNGLIRIPNIKVRSWRTFSQTGDVEQFTHIWSANKKVFLGGANGFITVFNTQTGTLQKHLHEPLSDMGTIYFDSKDDCLYFNKLNCIYKFKNDNFELVNKNSRPIKCILRNSQGYFILSSQGLFFASSINDSLTINNMIDQDWYRDICPSPFSSSFFAATNSGLVRIEKRGKSFKITKKYLKGKQVISICSDSQRKKIYFCSFDGSIYSLDINNKIKKIKQLGENVRVNQIRYYANRIFLVSNKGILTLNPKTQKMRLFNTSSGLASNNIRSIDFSGNLCWVAGEQLQRIPLSVFKDKKIRARILPRKILVNGKSIASNKLIEIDYNDKLTLIVDGLSYRSNGNFQFAYRIKGLNENWIKVPGEAEKIDFASLPTGNITIEIKLIDFAGQDSLNFIRYKLHVSPPFWQRWWFYVLITLSALVLASGIFRIRLKALRRKQKKELKHLRLENELSLTQQSALKAQMNPHFLFNVLNSIKGYIYDNDKKNAAKYLNDFSILVRKVLEMSAYSHVSLKEELEVLELYIRLEAMLMNDDFEYNIIIDDNVDTDNIQIPALVIQPYIENAFKHGLRHKVGSKKLSLELSFLSKEEILSIRIYDNGIGREESRKINEKNSNKYSSFATNALKQRLNLLNQKKPDLVGVEIRDVTSEETNLSVGTEIIIRIHIYEKDESNID